MIVKERVSGKLSMRGLLLIGCIAAVALPGWSLVKAATEEETPDSVTEGTPFPATAQEAFGPEAVESGGVTPETTRLQLDLLRLDFKEQVLKAGYMARKAEAAESAGSPQPDGRTELQMKLELAEFEVQRAKLRLQLFDLQSESPTSGGSGRLDEFGRKYGNYNDSKSVPPLDEANSAKLVALLTVARNGALTDEQLGRLNRLLIEIPREQWRSLTELGDAELSATVQTIAVLLELSELRGPDWSPDDRREEQRLAFRDAFGKQTGEIEARPSRN